MHIISYRNYLKAIIQNDYLHTLENHSITK
ncbi:MAG: hypothetical protein ACI9BJ_000507 [Flavobacteriales bacterium]